MPRDRDDDFDDRPRRPRRDDFDDEDDDRPRRRSRREDDEFDRPPPKSGGFGKTLLIVFGILGAVLLVCGGGAFLLLWPAYKKVQESKDRFEATNSMKAVVMRLHNHFDATDRSHAPYFEDTTVPPRPAPPPPAELATMMSWRVQIMTYLPSRPAGTFHPREPWDSPTNRPLANVVVKEYADADTPTDPATRVRLFYDNGALFDVDRNRRVGITGITDGSSNTIAYVESADKVTWTQFNDFRFDPNGPPPQLGKPNAGVFLAAMADGSVRQVRKTVSPQTLKAAITRSGGEVLGPDW